MLRWHGAGDRTRTCCLGDTSPARILLRLAGMVSSEGFEPTLSRLSTWCLSLLDYEDMVEAPGRL